MHPFLVSTEPRVARSGRCIAQVGPHEEEQELGVPRGRAEAITCARHHAAQAGEAAQAVGSARGPAAPEPADSPGARGPQASHLEGFP